MILADKIITLRKKNGWSQEELAERLNVTRQSVSKWEGAQSTPDLDKILKMSEIFGVSTDYLLKDDEEEEEYVETKQEEKLRRVSMEEANEFLAVKKWSVNKIALAIFLYIISPACMLFLGAASELGVLKKYWNISISENVAGGIGMLILLMIVAVATAICIYCGSKTKSFAFMEHELIDTEYGVTGMVKERQKKFKNTYYRYNIIGVCLCIFALIPLFVVAVTDENEIATVIALPLLLTIAGVGVSFFVRAGILWATMNKLLQEGEYSVESKKKSKETEPIVTIYWMIVTAIFFIYSFGFNGWGKSWIIWPVAGVLFAALMAVYNALKNK